MNNTKSQYIPNPSCPVSSRPSFREAIAEAEKQIELHAIDRYHESAKEICFIIAEVYLMNPNAQIKISGELLDGYLVQQVFRELTCEHVRLVLDNFHNVTYLVMNKKAYLRAALYNSVFEFNAHYTNLVNHHMKEQGEK